MEESELGTCNYCGDSYKPLDIVAQTQYSYPDACIPCISDFIDFFVQRHFDLILPDDESRVGHYFEAYKDEWRNQSDRVN